MDELEAMVKQVDAELLAKCPTWDEALLIPSFEAQAEILAANVPDYTALEYAWSDHPEWLPSREDHAQMVHVPTGPSQPRPTTSYADYEGQRGIRPGQMSNSQGASAPPNAWDTPVEEDYTMSNPPTTGPSETVPMQFVKGGPMQFAEGGPLQEPKQPPGFTHGIEPESPVPPTVSQEPTTQETPIEAETPPFDLDSAVAGMEEIAEPPAQDAQSPESPLDRARRALQQMQEAKWRLGEE